MVLVKPLLKEEISRHEKLILEWVRESYHRDITPSDFELIGNGVEKGVYKLNLDGKVLVAVAANRDGLKTLLPEYNTLHHLHRSCPVFFPRPHSHYCSSQEKDNGELIIMDFLPHLPIDVFNKLKVSDFHRKLAYNIGRDMAKVNLCTGMYSSEPHDGNILILQKDDDVDVKFCDASQFRHGGIDEVIQSTLNDSNYRPECFRHIKRFYAGILDGYMQEGRTADEPSLKKTLNQFNPIVE
ncbi:MAG: hypothetical protein Q8L27_01825 [archaeon]|nr:hypothetical protein [archaeon]